jgi:hypothetical protein
MAAAGGTSRSCTGLRGGAATPGASSGDLPHCLQNLAPALTAAPQCGHGFCARGGVAGCTLALALTRGGDKGGGGRGAATAGISCDGCVLSGSPASALPQRPQNLLPACTSAPHLGQWHAGEIVWTRAAAVTPTAAPQFPQNFLPSLISAWQFGQVIAHPRTYQRQHVFSGRNEP